MISGAHVSSELIKNLVWDYSNNKMLSVGKFHL